MRMFESRLRNFMTLVCHLEDLDHYNVSSMNGTDTGDYTNDNAINDDEYDDVDDKNEKDCVQRENRVLAASRNSRANRETQLQHIIVSILMIVIRL